MDTDIGLRRTATRDVVTGLLMILVAATVACTAGNGASSAPGHRGPDGCWRFAWEEGTDSTGRALVPAVLRLDTVRLSGYGAGAAGDTLFRAASLDGAVSRDEPFNAWRRLPADSVWVGHAAAYAGVVLRLHPGAAGETMSGTLSSYSDTRGPDAVRVRPVGLTRVPCPDPDG